MNSSISMLFVGLCLGALAAPSTGNEQYTLAEIEAALAKWRSSLKSVSLEMTYTYEPGPRMRDSHEKHSGIRNLVWVADGRFRGSGFANTTIYFDGQKWYEATEGIVRISRNGSATLWPPFDGLAFRAEGDGEAPLRWLDQLIHDGRCQHSGKQVVEGRAIPRLKVTQPDGQTLHVSLDPKFGFLPRLVEYKVTRTEIHEFTETSEGFWFPKKWTQATFAPDNGQLHDRWHWTRKRLEVNAKYDASTFRPSIPDGTKVIDRTTGRTYRQGEPPPGLSQEHREELWLVWIAGLAFSAAGLWICFRIWRVFRSGKRPD